MHYCQYYNQLLFLSLIHISEIVLAESLDSILVMKVDGKEVDINSKVELKEGQTVEFHLDYATKDKKPNDGDKFTFKLPEVFKDIIPSYPEHHFKDMNISESNESKIVTLICGNQIDTAIRGELGMSATVGSVSYTHLEWNTYQTIYIIFIQDLMLNKG